MKPILPFVTVAAALLCAASFPAQSAEPVARPIERPVLMARAELPFVAESQGTSARGKGPGDRGAKLAAAQGPEALRRFVDRTKTIYALHYEDYAAR